MAGTNLMQRLAGWLGRDPVDPVRPPPLETLPPQDPAYLQAARHLVGTRSGEQAHGWLAAGGDFLSVRLGDPAASIVERWNAGAGHATPVDHALAEGRAATAGTTGWLAYRGVRRPYALRYEQSVDTMIVLAALSDLVSNDVEVRLCRDSLGSDQLAFMALPPSQWHALAAEAGQKAMDRRLVAVPADFQELTRIALRDLPEWAATAHGRQP